MELKTCHVAGFVLRWGHEKNNSLLLAGIIGLLFAIFIFCVLALVLSWTDGMTGAVILLPGAFISGLVASMLLILCTQSGSRTRMVVSISILAVAAMMLVATILR